MPSEPTFHLLAVFAIVVAALVAFALERCRPEVTALTTLVALLLLFHVFPAATADGPLPVDALLAGFANPAVITVMALLVVGQAMVLTGAVEVLAQPLLGVARTAPRRTLGAAFLVVVASSAFLNNTPVVVIFIPLLRALADRLGMAHGRVMLPLSYFAMLGGMLTLVGSSSNLLVAAELRRLGGGSLGFFDMTLPGLCLAAVGAVYIGVWIWRSGLPTATGAREGLPGSGRQFIAEVVLQARSPLVGAESVGGFFPQLR